MSAPRFKYYTPEFEDLAPVAIYALPVESTGGHSDVSAEAIHAAGFPVPLTPTHQTWRSMVLEFKRCGRCFAEISGKVGLIYHNRSIHSGATPYFPE